MNTEVNKKSFYSVKSCQHIKSVKGVDLGARIVECVYNTYNYLDSQGDVLLPGCAKRSIKQNGPKSSAIAKVKHALFHDLTRLPGKIMELDERNIDGFDVIYSAVKMNDTTEGNDTLKNYQAEIYDNHSIGFQYLQMEYVERGTAAFDKVVGKLINPDEAEGRNVIWVVKEIGLWEGSTVSFGANDLTPCLGIKEDSTSEEQMAKLFERMDRLNKSLKAGTQSEEMLHSFDLEIRQIKQVLVEINNAPIDPKKIIEVQKKEEPIVLFSTDGVNNFFGEPKV